MYKPHKKIITTKVVQFDMETFYCKLANQKCLIITYTIIVK